MRQSLRFLCLITAGVLLVPAICLTGDTTVAPVTNQILKAGATIELPGLTIHGDKPPYIEAAGKMSQTNDILEFIAVETQGRDYESLLTLECKPSALKFALLLIGCEAAPEPQPLKPDTKAGTPLTLEVEWQAPGRVKRVKLEEWLLDRKTKKSPKPLPWIFLGSYFATSPINNKQVFQSDEEQAHISLWWQTSILINLGGEFGNPYRSDEQGFEVRSDAVPPKGTPLKLILRKQTK